MRDYNCRQGFNHPSHDIFTLEVLVRMSDIAETIRYTEWKVKLGLTSGSGERISVATRKVTVNRVFFVSQRMINERPLINIHLQLEDVSQSSFHSVGNLAFFFGGLSGGFGEKLVMENFE